MLCYIVFRTVERSLKAIAVRSASPFQWAFTRHDLHALLAKILVKRLALAA